MEKKKFRISGKLIFNLAVVAISIYLIIYFFVSEDGLIDLLKKPDGCNMLIILAALLIYDLNILVDAVVTLIYVRSKYENFSFIEALKVAFVGVFFSAITPSSTGGQPMQLYLMSKKNISVGFGSACMTQKFIVYQIVMTAVSVIAVITRFNYFSDAFTNIWSTLFIIFGFTVQLAMTALFLLVSFSHKVTNKLINLIYKIMKKFKFIKNPEKKVERLHKEVDMFHDTNKQLFSSVKRLVVIYALVFIQVILILSIPYLIYIAFGMAPIARAAGQPPLSFYDSICIQSFVLFTANLIPLPGASGGAELAFTMYFGSFFKIGAISKIKPAILMWRFITYYGAILISAPFSYFTKGKRRDDEIKKIEEELESEMENKKSEEKLTQ